MSRTSTIRAIVRERIKNLKDVAAQFRKVENAADRGASLIKRYSSRRNFLITTSEVQNVLGIANEVDNQVNALIGMLQNVTELVTTT